MAMLAQVAPRAAAELLEDYERVLGLDPCGRDLVETSRTQDERRRSAHQPWTASGQPTPAYSEAIAAQLGLSFWDYLGARLAVPGQPAIPYLPDPIRARRRPA